VRSADTLLSLLSPPLCVACEASLWGEEGPLCPICAGAAEALPNPCPRCGQPDLYGVRTSGSICGLCREGPPRYDACVALWRYGGSARELVTGLKARRPWAAEPLGRALAARWRLEGLAADGVVHVPPGRARLRARGFDQAGLLARALASALGLPHLSRALIRPRPGPRQAGLSLAARRRLPLYTFLCPRPEGLAGKRLLLVDDVVTTGATVSACAWALRGAGAATVSVAALCRAVREL